MHKLKIDPRLFVATTYGTIMATALLYGCQSAQNPSAAAGGASAGQPSFALFGTTPEKSGAELWADNCGRCHNIRPPDEFSGAQWAAIGQIETVNVYLYKPNFASAYAEAEHWCSKYGVTNRSSSLSDLPGIVASGKYVMDCRWFGSGGGIAVNISPCGSPSATSMWCVLLTFDIVGSF
jgi:hypothetical protein